MTVKILFDANGYIKSFALIGGLKNAIDFNEEFIDKDFLKQLSSDYRAYHLIDGKLVKDEAKLEEIQHENKLAKLRALRETECFSVINRSTLWYNTLSEEQKIELNTWYHAWLDVTETLLVPEKPEWLK